MSIKITSLGLYFLIAAALIACDDDKRGAGGPVGAASPSAAPSLSAPHMNLTEPAWVGKGPPYDDLLIRRLAMQHDAQELWVMVQKAGPASQAALAALGHAEDAQLVIAELAELAELATDAGRGEAALKVLLQVASRAPTMGEALDPDSLAGGLKRLHALSRDAAQPRARRALAISVLRAFARGGYLDGAGINKALDPGVDAK